MDEILLLVKDLVAENLKLRRVVQSNLRETETISRTLKDVQQELQAIKNEVQ